MDYRIEQLRYLLREDPSSRIFFQLGELLRREGDPAEAVNVLETGLERHPRYVAAWVSLGRSQRDLGSFAEAEKAFEKALEIDRENPVAARLLGETAVEREDWVAAIKALKLSRALTGSDDELEERIKLVEGKLAAEGRLETPAPPPAPVERPARSLEVVSLSAEDPFAPAAGEADAWDATSDVFEILAGDEIPADAEIADVEEETLAEEPELPAVEVSDDETAAVEPVGPGADEVSPETVADAASDTDTETDTDTVTEPDVDESSIGAWSAAAAAGVPGEEAWAEPTDQLAVTDETSDVDEPWVEPAPAEGTMLETETETETEAATETETETETDTATESDSEAGAVVEPEPVPPPVEVQRFESIEVTHPDVVDQRAGETAAAEVVESEAPATEPPVHDPSLPGEDRGIDAIEATRPIPVAETAIEADADEVADTDTDTVADTETETETAAATETATDTATDMAPDTDDVAIGGRRHELDHGVPLPTMTLAKLALDQDDRPLAMATLESLIERDPDNDEAHALLDELRARDRLAADERRRAEHAAGKIEALQGWLNAVRLAAEGRTQ